MNRSTPGASVFIGDIVKRNYPELIDRFNIPLDEYPRRCVHQIEEWKKQRDQFVENDQLTHERSKEYASYMIEAMEYNEPIVIGGNVMNTVAELSPDDIIAMCDELLERHGHWVPALQ